MNIIDLTPPATATGFIGPAARIATSLEIKVRALRAAERPFRAFFCGPAGVGKTALCLMAARQLTGSELGFEMLNGANVTADVVRRWHDEFFAGSMFNAWRALVIDEADCISPQAQRLMLTFLDQLPARRAVFCTSNATDAELIERFQSRFQLWNVPAPTVGEITAILRRSAPALPEITLRDIAAGCGGNVRAALNDAQTALDYAAT